MYGLSGKRIGLLESDEGNRKALEHLLSNAGAETKILSEPLDHTRLNTEHYDLVVLGDQERNGVGTLVKLCQELKYPPHRSSHIPLLIISSLGIDAKADARILEAAGADAVFRKPYATEELLAIATQLTLSPQTRLERPIILEPLRTRESDSPIR